MEGVGSSGGCVRYLGTTLVQMMTRTQVDDRLRATVGELCQAFDMQFRIGDKVLITEGFYTGVHAYISDRRWDGEFWRYELLGDPSQKVAIEHHDNAFFASQFRLRELQ